MKKFTRITAAFLLIFSMLITVIPFSVEVSAATLVYSKQSNSGKRGDVCLTLDGTSAGSYYTGNYTYDALDDLSSSAVFSALQTLMRTTQHYKSTYGDCHYKADKTDCEENNGKVTLIYTSYQATMQQWNGWNREHVWPKSLGGKTDDDRTGGADLHHIRPSDAVVNSTRNNNKYGNTNGGSAVYGRTPAAGYLGGYYKSGYYEPLDSVKGDVARICLYVYVRWNSEWGANDITNVFQSIDVLLEWCELDPVDTWEMGRNEVIQSIQGNRNVFIDYPEYAWLIFGREVPASMTTPSGEAAKGGSNGGSGSGSGGSTSCSHASTEVRNKTNATCGKKGYTGDTYCLTCGAKIASGSSIKATGNHSFGEWVLSNGTETRTCSVCGKTETQACTHKTVEIRDVKSPTCALEGYSGDTYCTDCNTVVTAGAAVTPTGEHTYDSWKTDGDKQTGVCTVCEAAAERPVPECAHTATEVIGAIEPTCGNDGFSGVTVCKDCRSLINEGSIVPATGDHKNTVLQNQKDATCGNDGYSGDTYCNDCQKMAKQGEVVPATGKHSFIEGEVISEPTKKKNGLRMDACEVCGHVEGIVLPKTGNDNNTTVIIIIAVSAAVVIGAAVVITVIVVKKKKAK